MSHIAKKTAPVDIEDSIRLLNKYITDESINPVISILEALQKDPDNESIVAQLIETLDTIGVMKGAVLTYAPYIAILISDGLFED